MVMQDTLANVLSNLNNVEKVGKSEAVLKPASNLIRGVLTILKKENYIADFKFIDNSRGGALKVKLKGSINKVGVIKPRFSVKIGDLEKFEKRYLPAKDFGRIILSTPKGLITHVDAREKNTGGVLVAYVY